MYRARRAQPNAALAVIHPHGGHAAQSTAGTAALAQGVPRLEKQPLPAHNPREGDGVVDFLKRHVLEPLEAGAPIALPYIAAAGVLGLCPECLLTAALAAGVTSYGAHKEIEHERTGPALVAAAIDAAGEYGGDIAKKALIREVDGLLAKNEITAASNVMLGAILNARRYDLAEEFHHR